MPPDLEPSLPSPCGPGARRCLFPFHLCSSGPFLLYAGGTVVPSSSDFSLSLGSRPAPSIHAHPCTPGSSCLPETSICLLRYPKVTSSSASFLWLFLWLPTSPLALVGYSFSSLFLTASIIVGLVELHWTDPVFTPTVSICVSCQLWRL